MADKMECPGCGSYTSHVLDAVRTGHPCPHCGLSASAITEIQAVRERGANAELTAKYEAALIRADKAEGDARYLRNQLLQIRNLANRNHGEFETPF